MVHCPLPMPSRGLTQTIHSKSNKRNKGKIWSFRKGRDSVSWRRTGIMADFVNEVTSRPALSDGWDLKKWAWRRRELENVNMKKAV